MKNNKENKRAFALKVVAAMNANPEYKNRDYTVEEIEMIFSTILEQMIETTKEGKELFFTGFGSFYLQRHKGHPVQFNSSDAEISDYVTLKFSASNNLNTKLREEFRAGKAFACEKQNRTRK